MPAFILQIAYRLFTFYGCCSLHSFYTKILSPSCDKTFEIPTCPESQLLEWKLILFFNLCIQIPNTALYPLSRSGTPVCIAHLLLPTSGATAYGP